MKAAPMTQRFYFWFFALTLIYITTQLIFNLSICIDYCPPEVPGSHIVAPFMYFIGMFVPIGLSNLILIELTPIGWAAAALVLWSLLFWEKILAHYNFPPKGKIAMILVLLFALTLIVDLLTTGKPTGVMLFFDSLGSLFSH
jgi:hypothetical protein